MEQFDKWTELRNAIQLYVDCGEIHFMPILDKMDELDAKEASMKPTFPAFQIGDKVRHKNYREYGTGIVKKIPTGRKLILVDFSEIDDWDRKKIMWTPKSYFNPASLELIEEADQS